MAKKEKKKENNHFLNGNRLKKELLLLAAYFKEKQYYVKEIELILKEFSKVMEEAECSSSIAVPSIEVNKVEGKEKVEQFKALVEALSKLSKKK